MRFFGGYVHFRQDKLLYNQEDEDPETIKLLLAELKQKNQVSVGLLFAEEESIPDLNTIEKLLDFIPAWMQAAAQRHLDSLRFYSQELIDQFHRRDVYRQFFNHIDVKGQLKGREPVNQSLYLWSKTNLANYLLRMLGDGVEMAHSIEGRLPFLDHKVVELVRNMPISLKINGLTEKYVLREAAKPFITDTVYKRQKHPFIAPPSTFNLKEPLQQLIQDTLRSSAMSHLPFYNQCAIVQLLDKLPAMNDTQRATTDFLLLRVLSAYFLQEKFALT
ncbi:asparagine synthase C-terminal domain-containing protein [Nostoc piscinale]|uniref:asparagine synthase-related protein n=1 Tax=Nostoc piscinale TaxID=224012 RepID=UPI000AA7E112|nr:asparagine synthase C-terminal domain-containing protein [Nostoc piscinale]